MEIIDLSLFEYRIFSQNGEDGIIIKLLELIYDENNNKNKYYVEFGVENGNECNTRILREKYNWNGLQMDGTNENFNINLRKEFITKENITELFLKYNVPKTINILSIDIDFNDFYCLNEILKKYKCDIIICEYNSTHHFDEDKIVQYDKNGKWDGSNYFGASLLSLNVLCEIYNYSLIYCNSTGVNCFFIHDDIIKTKNLNFLNCKNVSKIYRPPYYGNGPRHGHRHDSLNRTYITSGKAISGFY